MYTLCEVRLCLTIDLGPTKLFLFSGYIGLCLILWGVMPWVVLCHKYPTIPPPPMCTWLLQLVLCTIADPSFCISYLIHCCLQKASTMTLIMLVPIVLNIVQPLLHTKPPKCASMLHAFICMLIIACKHTFIKCTAFNLS